MKCINYKCPKCGCIDIKVRYKDGYDYGMHTSAEYLEMICQRCNYTWNENCLDHEKI